MTDKHKIADDLTTLAYPINKLKHLNGNPRKGNVEAVKKSYKKFGQRKPIVATKDGEVISGNHQLAAAKDLGWNKIAVVFTDDDELTAKAFALADNRTADLGSYDDDLLADMLGSVSSDLELLEATSFDEKDLIALVKKQEVIEDDAPAIRQTEIKLGQKFKLGNHTLVCGDATNKKHLDFLINNNLIDLLLIDPPYGIDANKQTLGNGKKDFYRGNDWDKNKVDILPLLDYAKYSCVWGGNYYADILKPTNDWLCWFKKIKNVSFSEFELAWTNFGKQARILEHHWSGEQKLHPTAKPIKVMTWVLNIIDNENVLDVFGGSGSTLIACEQLERNCFIMEIDTQYCQVIIDRWQKLTGQKAELIDNL